MEKLQCVFDAVTHFSVVKVKKYDPRFEEVETLTLEIGSKSPLGKYPLVLVEPFPPFGRPGKELDKLASLRAEDIESVWAFRKSDDGQSSRLEIRGKANVFISCDVIEGVPGWDEPLPDWRPDHDE